MFNMLGILRLYYSQNCNSYEQQKRLWLLCISSFRLPCFVCMLYLLHVLDAMALSSLPL